MDAARLLREGRVACGLSQRALAQVSGVAQPTIARIEAGRESPRVATLDRLLRPCGLTVTTRPVPGAGVDRSVIRTFLAMTPAQRLSSLVDEARVLERLSDARRLP